MRRGARALNDARAASGFTLLEILLAIVLFAIGTIAAMDLLHRAQAGINDGETTWTATHLAQMRAEELRNTAYASLADEAEARISSPSGFSQFCRQVTVTTPYTNLKQITVAVSWDPPDCLTSSANPNVILQMYRSNV